MTQCRPGLCDRLNTCNDKHCPGHPCNDIDPGEFIDPPVCWIIAGYVAFVVACGLLIANADAIYWLFK